MAKYVYRTPLEGTGVAGDPYVPAHEDELSADPAHYQRHYRLQDGHVLIASNYRLATYEELAEDPTSDVEVVDEAELAAMDADGRAHHTPEELAETRDTSVEEMTGAADDEPDEGEDDDGDGEEDQDEDPEESPGEGEEDG